MVSLAFNRTKTEKSLLICFLSIPYDADIIDGIPIRQLLISFTLFVTNF